MSIPLHSPAFCLPDFRNQGIWLRVLLTANGLMLVVALSANRSPALLFSEITQMAALVEPALLLTLAVLHLLNPALHKQTPLLGGALVVLLALCVMLAIDHTSALLFGMTSGWRAPLAAAGGALFILIWLDLLTRARTPALAEARLAALTARIRPHFLFNSLNAVLGIIRDDPRRAEATLEELAELFRALMRDSRELVPISDELALARKYIEIETLRLGERLQVSWTIEACPPDLLAPPLLLQPLLENAVHHGIEPAATPGEIRVRIAPTRDGLRIEIDNPWLGEHSQRPGNRMALDNVRERLMLFYDLEARLETRIENDRYRVCITLPDRRHG